MYRLHRTLLTLFHILYELALTIHNCYRVLRRKCNDFFYGENSWQEIETLAETMYFTRNLPKHVVIVMGHKAEYILDCVRIIGWCISLGIPYISFYDRTGFMASLERDLRDDFAKKRPDLDEHIIWGRPTGASARNGITGSKSATRVLFFSDEDGRGEIISLTQQLAKAALTGSIKLEEIDENLLSEKLMLQGIPDPDLAIIRSQVCSTYGMLPWNTRVTEFFVIPGAGNVTVREFTRVLVQYSKCEQRYGK